MKFKKILTIMAACLLGSAAVATVTPFLVSCSNDNGQDNNNPPSGGGSEKPDKPVNPPEKPDKPVNPPVNPDKPVNPPTSTEEKIKNAIQTNFNKVINSDNFIPSFYTKEDAINTIVKLSDNLLKAESVQNLNISNASSPNDENLLLNIEVSLNNKATYANANNNVITISNLKTNVINVDSNANKAKFIYSGEKIVGIKDEYLNTEELYFPSDFEVLGFDADYGPKLTNVRKMNFSFAKNLVLTRENAKECMFRRTPKLEYVSFFGCKGVKTTPNALFSRCDNLKEIDLSNCTSLVFLGDWFADYCPSLTKVNLTNCSSLKEIGGAAFDNCTNLESIDLSQTAKFWKGIWQSSFNACGKLKNINVANIVSIATLSPSAFIDVATSTNNNKLTINASSAYVYNTFNNVYKTQVSAQQFIVKMNPNVPVGIQGIENGIQNQQYNENAFLENAERVAKDNSVLYYNVNNSGVMHTYGTIAHIVKVLELNPNKEMHLFLSKKVWTDGTKKAWNIELLNNKSKYPNLTIHYMNEPENQGLSSNFILQYANEIINTIDKDEKEHGKRTNIMYIADVNYNWFAKGSINDNNVIKITPDLKTNLSQTYFRLNKRLSEVNIIPDGTMSTDAFSNKLYDLYKSGNELFKYNATTGLYDNLIALQSELNKFSEAQFRAWLDKDSMNPWYYLCSLISSNNTGTIKDVPQVNYFLQATDLVKDVNNTSSTQFNDNVLTNEYFDPYNSLGINFIGFLQTLNKDSSNLFFDITKTEKIDQSFFDEFANHTNVIYGGSLMGGNDTTTTNEANRLIKLVKMNNAKYENVIVWFKGHPRDHDGYKERLLNKVSQLVDQDSEITDKQAFKNQIKVLNKNIPLEMYAASGLFTNDPTTHRVIKQYLTYSTYALSVVAHDKSELEKIILDENAMNDVKRRFGDPKVSLCFPQDLVISSKDFLA